MRRAKHPVPFALNRLQYNPKSNLYEISEKGIIYGMAIEMTRSLKSYFENYTSQTVSEWYGSLSREDRAKVERTGAREITDSSFYPDQGLE